MSAGERNQALLAELRALAYSDNRLGSRYDTGG